MYVAITVILTSVTQVAIAGWQASFVTETIQGI